MRAIDSRSDGTRGAQRVPCCSRLPDALTVLSWRRAARVARSGVPGAASYCGRAALGQAPDATARGGEQAMEMQARDEDGKA